jgi:hypothetical protein
MVQFPPTLHRTLTALEKEALFGKLREVVTNVNGYAKYAHGWDAARVSEWLALKVQSPEAPIRTAVVWAWTRKLGLGSHRVVRPKRERDLFDKGKGMDWTELATMNARIDALQAQVTNLYRRLGEDITQ